MKRPTNFIVWETEQFWLGVNEILSETEDQPPLPDDAIIQDPIDETRGDRVLFRFTLPPPLQALCWERYRLQQDELELRRRKSARTAEDNRLITKLQFQQGVLVELYREGLTHELHSRMQAHAVSVVKTRDVIWDKWDLAYVERNE